MSTNNQDLTLLTQNVQNGTTYDLSELVESFSLDTDIGMQAGSLKVSFVKHATWTPSEGDIVRFQYKGYNMFYGKVFIRRKATNGHWDITAYDQLRYLQNTDTVAVPAMTSGQLFNYLCALNDSPRYRVVDDSGYACPAIIHDGKSYMQMLDDALGKTIVNTGTWYIIRDSFGTLEHVSLNSLRTNLLIGDESLLTDFSYESSIDESYNTIKLTRDNKDTNKRDVFMVYDSSKQAWWGKLQYHQSINEDYNDAQAQALAHAMMDSLSNVNKELKITAIGHPAVSAGTGIYIKISELSSEGLDTLVPVFITKCTHKASPFHTMDLTVKVV